MTTCPCCANPMLRHVRQHQTYWFCRTCWQEMPELEQLNLNSIQSVLKQHFVPVGVRRSPAPI